VRRFRLDQYEFCQVMVYMMGRLTEHKRPEYGEEEDDTSSGKVQVTTERRGRGGR
jgi:hypothetical protein